MSCIDLDSSLHQRNHPFRSTVHQNAVQLIVDFPIPYVFSNEWWGVFVPHKCFNNVKQIILTKCSCPGLIFNVFFDQFYVKLPEFAVLIVMFWHCQEFGSVLLQWRESDFTKKLEHYRKQQSLRVVSLNKLNRQRSYCCCYFFGCLLVQPNQLDACFKQQVYRLAIHPEAQFDDSLDLVVT